MKKKDILIAIIATAFMILGSIDVKVPTVPEEEPTETIIKWKQETEVEEVHIEEVVVETVTEQQVGKIKFYNVPLSEDLQMHLFQECDGRNIAPAIVLAMIERESDYIADKIGDNGESFGLMQIQPKWHKETMQLLGCNDLLDPYQNISVGVKIISDLKEKNPDLYWVLMAYNAGPSKATEWQENDIVSEYAMEVVERASELEREFERGVENGLE